MSRARQLLATLFAAVAMVAASAAPAQVSPAAPQKAAAEPGFFGVAPQNILHKKDYKRMGAGGVGLLRVPLSWDQVQSKPGDCEPEPQVDVCSWSEFDAIVGQAAAKGIRVFPTLGGRPAFTIKGKGGDSPREHPPINGPGLEAWRDFTAAAAARYGRDGTFWTTDPAFGSDAVEARPIEDWQVWNEPNAASYWPPEPRAGEYATLLGATAESIRSSDPEAEIVMGGMFGSATVPAAKYLRKLYGIEGISEYFDSISIHPYAPGVEGVQKQAVTIRKAAIRAGDEDVGLWATELGWGSGNGGHPLEVGDKKQAKRLDGAFELFLDKREIWNVEGVTWFTWEDRADHKVCRFCRHAGLFDVDAAPKASWKVFRTYTLPDEE